MSLSPVPRMPKPGAPSTRLMDHQDTARGDSTGVRRSNLSFRFPVEVADELAARAAAMGVTKTAYMVMALRNYFGNEIR